jgi:AbrB family looped-hinge helix DNA binding protein
MCEMPGATCVCEVHRGKCEREAQSATLASTSALRTWHPEAVRSTAPHVGRQGRADERRGREPMRPKAEPTSPHVATKWYPDGMRTTIDKAGRVVIPAAVRERAGLTPGTELEVTVDDFAIRIERVAPGPRLVRVGRRVVARPTAAADARPVIDIGALVEEERNRWP